jgi:hypothetical protein
MGGHAMSEYTRQRNWRDFILQGYFSKVADTQRDDDIKKADENNKSLHDRLEQYRKEAERNAVPVDGHEPPERGKNLV